MNLGQSIQKIEIAHRLQHHRLSHTFDDEATRHFTTLDPISWRRGQRPKISFGDADKSGGYDKRLRRGRGGTCTSTKTHASTSKVRRCGLDVTRKLAALVLPKIWRALRRASRANIDAKGGLEKVKRKKPERTTRRQTDRKREKGEKKKAK